MNSTEAEIATFCDELIAKGERLSKIIVRPYDNQPGSGVVIIGMEHEFPATADEYHRWDNDCQILLEMLGKKAKPFEAGFKGSTYQIAQINSEAPMQKLGALKSIRDAIEKGRLRISDAADIPTARASHSGTNTIHNYGGNINLNSPHSPQAVSTNITEFHRAADRLKQAVDASELDDFDKEEIGHAIDRVKDLANRERTDKTVRAVKEKLTVIEKMIGVSTKLAAIAKPILPVLSAWLQSK